MDVKPLSSARIFEYEVLGDQKHAIGIVEGIWTSEPQERLQYIGVSTGVLGGDMHAIPVSEDDIDDATRTVHTSFTVKQVTGAPVVTLHEKLTPQKKQAINGYYRQ
ncbi:MAG: hypothetical protein ACRDFX_08280 [Chloroflexota bacterium]